jgi:hypothetical protein
MLAIGILGRSPRRTRLYFLASWDMQPISIPPAFEAKKLDGSKSNDGQYSAAHIPF